MARGKFTKGDMTPSEIASLGGKATAENNRKLRENIIDWKEFGRFLETEGITMAKEELRELKGTALVSSLASLLEYFQPKLARTESKNENKNETTVKIDEQTLDTIKSAIQNL